MPAIESVVSGSHFSRVVVLGNPNGATYTGAATLAGSVWPGDAQAELFAPTVTWVSPSTPSVLIVATAAQTATLATGDYPVLVTVTEGGFAQKEIACYIRVTPAPGAGTAAAVYCTATDLFNEIPWLRDLQSPDDQAGFAEARADARAWVDSVILSRLPGGNAGFGPRELVGDGTGQRDWIKAKLDDDGLILTDATGKQIKRAACLCAAYRVLSRQVGERGEDTYQALGDTMRREAESILSTGLAWIDTDDDGTGELAIDLSVVRCGRG